MNAIHFGDPLTSYLAPPVGQHFHVSSETFQHLLDELAQNSAHIHVSQKMYPYDLHGRGCHL